jgi:eukaryotic-like serine/threonine-protein kinase
LTSNSPLHPDTRLLVDFAAGAVGGHDLDRVAEHLEQCETCRAQVDDILSGDRLLDRMRLATTLAEDSGEHRAERRRQASALRRQIDRNTVAAPVRLPEPEGPAAPREIANYEVLREIGRGGMGVVYHARDRRLQRLVALKMILAGGFASEVQRQRFQREAELAARVQHPNIVQVYEAGVYEGHPFLVMEWVSGVTLADRMGTDPWSVHNAARLIETLARAIESAHGKGVVHRDLKPSNILLQTDAGGDPSGPLAGVVPKIADFGLARLIEGAERLTTTGMAVGTPEYMAPEQASKGAVVGPRADVYALGAVLYQLLTGRPPFRGDTPMEVLQALASAEPVSPRRLRPRLERDLETITLKALEKDPARRFATAGALAEDLRRFLAGEPILARPPTAWERLEKWARRRPAQAALSGCLIAVTVVAFTGITALWGEAAGARDRATTSALEARRRGDAERRARYQAAVAAADGALELGNLDVAWDFLEAAPEEHRNWEWRYFAAQLDNARLVFRPDDGPVSVFALAPSGEFFAYAVTGGRDVRIRAPVIQSSPAIFEGLAGKVASIAISADDSLVAAGSTDGTARIWRVADGRKFAVLAVRGGAVQKMRFVPDGSRLVTFSADENAHVWNLATGQCLTSFPAWNVQVSPNGLRLVALHDGKAQLRDLATGDALRDLTVSRGDDVACAAFSPDGRRIAVGTRQPASVIRLLDVDGGSPPVVLTGHKNTVLWLAFSPDGRMVASTSLDKTLRLWDVGTAHSVAILHGQKTNVRDGAFSRDGRRLIMAAGDRTARVWDTIEGTSIYDLRCRAPSVIEPAVSRDGSAMVKVDESGAVNFWDVDSAMRQGLLKGHTRYVYDVAISPDGRTVASAAWDGTVRLWNTDEGREISVLRHSVAGVTAVAFNPDGRRAASVGQDGLIRLWDLASGRPEWSLQLAKRRTQNVEFRVNFSPHGDLLAATGGQDRLVQLVDANTGAPTTTCAGHEAEVSDAVFSPDGTRLASADWGGTVRFWSTADWAPLATIESHSERIHRLAFSHDSRILASASQDRTVRLWDTASQKRVATLAHGAVVFGLAFNPDGTRLATACEDGTVRVWDAATFTQVAGLRGHGDYVHAVAFSPDGHRIVSGSGDYTVRVWDSSPSGRLARPKHRPTTE